MDYISVTEEQHKKLCEVFELKYQPIEFEPIPYDGYEHRKPWNKGKIIGPTGARPQEVKDRISKSHIGKKHSQETKQKIKDKHKRCWLGKNHTEESILKMKFPKSEEHKRKISESHKGKILNKQMCPHCCKLIGINNIKRYHLDNCKKKIDNE